MKNPVSGNIVLTQPQETQERLSSASGTGSLDVSDVL